MNLVLPPSGLLNTDKDCSDPFPTVILITGCQRESSITVINSDSAQSPAVSAKMGGAANSIRNTASELERVAPEIGFRGH